ncbi:MAG TPA: YcbK family protein [Thermodesulfovibrionales bacterium]|nr:YcbK family protein [Thermodesulfovibrionales bacterium]
MKSKTNSDLAMSFHGLSRRDFLKAGLVATAACLFPHKALAAVTGVSSVERTLTFYNTHTGEKIKAVYWIRGAYLPQALADVNNIMRDYRTGEVKEIDPDLLDLLFALGRKLRSSAPYHIISGYRSAETNLLLRGTGKGVARNSLHIDGKAIDIRIPGYELKTLQRAALDLKRGGVGYYPGSDFVHVDVGKIRRW